MNQGSKSTSNSSMILMRKLIQLRLRMFCRYKGSAQFAIRSKNITQRRESTISQYQKFIDHQPNVHFATNSVQQLRDQGSSSFQSFREARDHCIANLTNSHTPKHWLYKSCGLPMCDLPLTRLK